MACDGDESSHGTDFLECAPLTAVLKRVILWTTTILSSGHSNGTFNSILPVAKTVDTIECSPQQNRFNVTYLLIIYVTPLQRRHE